MKSPIPKLLSILTVALGATVILGNSAQAQTAYGYNSVGTLFSFSVTSPGALSTIGSLGFTPEGIDFNPQNNVLFAVDIGAVTSTLYTVNLGTAVTTSVGTFASAGSSGATIYDFSNSLRVGFDFNPKTVQTDGSIRIRLVSSDGDNIRLRSNDIGTGVFAAADTRLSGFLTGADGVGYNSNFPELASVGAATSLYYISNGVNELAVNNGNPNAGVIQDANTGAVLGVVPANGTGLDVFTAANQTTNTGYFVTDSDSNNISELYRIDNIGSLAVAATLVGNTGAQGLQDIAVLTVPEPGTFAILVSGALGLVGMRRRRS